MKYKNVLVAVLGLVIFIAVSSSLAGKPLTRDEAIALFKDKTFDGTQVVKDKSFRIYSSPDGAHEIHFSNGKVKSRYWWINNDGEHCISKREGKGGKCSTVISVGGGVYHKITNDEHTHTLKNFVDGNQV